jgi:hypothetical protein
MVFPTTHSSVGARMAMQPRKARSFPISTGGSRQTVFFAGLGIFLSLLGCTKEPRQDVQAAFALMPKDVDLLYGFSLETAQASGFSARKLVALLPEQQGAFALDILEELKSLCPEKDLAFHYVVGAQRYAEVGGHFVALNGPMDRGLLRTCFANARPRIDVGEETVLGTNLVSYRRSGTEVHGYWADKHTLTFTVPNQKKRAAELATTKLHASDNLELAALRKRLDPKAILWVIGRVPPARKGAATASLPSPTFFVTNVTPQWNVEIALVYPKEADAKSAKDVLGQGLQPTIDRLNLGLKAGDVSIRQEGNELLLRVHVEPQDVKDAAARLAAMNRSTPKRAP